MRAGILTYHFANNYGAVLQTYSLQAVLEKLNVDVEVIDFQSEHQSDNQALMSGTLSLKSIIKNMARLPHYFARKRCIQKFESFRDKYLILSRCSFSDPEEAKQFIEHRYDVVIVGSDQVWNPSVDDFDDIYFTVSGIQIPVYAYAVSLGKAKQDSLMKFRKNILQFSEISVREAASVDFLHRIDSEIVPQKVLDPTLLQTSDFFEKISVNPGVERKEYMVCYYVGRRGAVSFRRATEKLARKFACPVYFIHIGSGLASYGAGVINDCGPEEFLGYLKNAKLVCTNSFHAVALSLQLGVPFFSFETGGYEDKRKSDLIQKLKLTDRMVYDFDISSIKSYEMSKVDLESRLRDDRKCSVNYLKRVIEI